MISKLPEPGVSRLERISTDGLKRLEKQLDSGVRISTEVLAQWIRRYGDSARQIIKKHKQYRPELDDIR